MNLLNIYLKKWSKFSISFSSGRLLNFLLLLSIIKEIKLLLIVSYKIGSGGRIRTCDLQVMSLTSYRAAPPREEVESSNQNLMLRKPGSDLLSHDLRRSTIGAEDFYFRVRNGIGYGIFAITTRLFKYHI